MRRTASFVIVLVLGGALVGFHATGSFADSDGKTLKLVEKSTSFQFVDNAPSGDSAGDQFVFAGDLFKNKDGKTGAKAGTFSGTCTAVKVEASTNTFLIQCYVTYVLKGGNLVLSAVINEGAEGPHTFMAAVLGGTGDYRGARGDAKLKEASEDVIFNTITLL